MGARRPLDRWGWGQVQGWEWGGFVSLKKGNSGRFLFWRQMNLGDFYEI
jgi:hypothetical protein